MSVHRKATMKNPRALLGKKLRSWWASSGQRRFGTKQHLAIHLGVNYDRLAKYFRGTVFPSKALCWSLYKMAKIGELSPENAAHTIGEATRRAWRDPDNRQQHAESMRRYWADKRRSAPQRVAIREAAARVARTKKNTAAQRKTAARKAARAHWEKRKRGTE